MSKELLKVIDRCSCLTPIIDHTLRYLRLERPADVKLGALEVAKATLNVIKTEFEIMENVLKEAER